MNAAEPTVRMSLADWARRAEPHVRVVREAEAAYDVHGGASVAIDAPPAPRAPASAKRLPRSRHRIATAASLDRLCIHDDQDVLLIPIRTVLYAQHDGGQITIESDQQSLTVRLTLDRPEGVLAPFGLFRSHRAFLVNLRRVRRIVTWSRHVHNLMLDDPKETLVPLAKGRQAALRASFLWP